jgi:serine/threonine protein kinase
MVPEDWQAVQWDTGCGDGLFITILYHNKRFHVSLLPPSSTDTIEEPLIARFEFMDDEDGDEIQAAQDEIGLIVYGAGKSIWTQLAPPLPEGEKPLDLHSHLYPETFTFRFITNNGKAELIPHEIEGFEAYDHDPRPNMKIINDMGLPQYSSKDICVLETLVGQEGYITRVLVEGREMCCKAGEEAFSHGIEREFDCLRKVARSELVDSIRVPRLLGLVTSAETGMVIGILEEYVPTGELCDLRLLEDEDIEASPERRQKWAAQIRETVDLLHKIGGIWGYGKPDNVLIHEVTDDAWVIDFGGSYTNGWVDQELTETLEGDEQAVGKILEFLKI